ncbi:MAP10 protein, partial [Burhinus bistriatus]|nr:MAP10 protein [Burhinus bistriatus]
RAFPFGRGKRCLFRWRRGSLCTALRRRPLRALLLALPAGFAPGTPRLLGSCGVSLAPAAAELLQRPEAPASCGRRGSFLLRDAAGRPVGQLVLGYRLTSLEGEEEELEGNIFCPPVLYYSREPAEPPLPPAGAAAGKWERVEAWRLQERDKGQSPPRPSAGPSVLHPTSPQQLRNTLGQLPLLSALLAELSVLTHSSTPAAVHPHLAWLYQAPGSDGMASQPVSRSSALKPAEAPVGPGGRSGAASPQFKQGQQEATSQGSSQAGGGPKKAVPQGETGSERNCKTKENRPPRRRLLYGLTNTLRLRLQQTNPDKLIIHERREQYRKKQMEMLKERSSLSKRKLVRNGEQHVVSYRHCIKGDSSKQNNQFDKTVGTSLQNSTLTEYISVTDVSPELQEQAIASLLKNDKIASKERPCKVTTDPLVDEPVFKSAHKEKYAKAQLPAAFPSDANAKGSNEEAIQLIRHKTMEHDDASVISDHKRSPSRSAENNSEFIYSDDFVASPENTVYSEDFTSAEFMSRDSEALDSSPEPLWLESPKQGWSDTEPASGRSRISKTNQRAESTSDLLPVPSASSPVQSLKRNSHLKNSERTSGESVDSLNRARMEASLLDEEQEAQQISKEENRVDQHIKQVSMLRSKQVSSDTDLSIGKGQTSAGKSQSVTQVSSYLPSNMTDLQLSVLENSISDKEDDFLEKLCVPNQYKDISELVINKLPGYTM